MNRSEKITNEKADLLLSISSMLMTAGANTNRILLIINKFSDLLHTNAQIFINHKAFIITLTDKHSNKTTTQVKRLPPHVINFSTISALSLAGAKANKENWSFKQIKEEIYRINNQSHHPRYLTLIAVSFAGAGLAILFGGSYDSFIAVFIGTLFGLFIKQEYHRREFNPYLGTFVGTLVSSLVAALIITKLFPETDPNIAIATSVLFSIPGVPLINSFTDFLDGYFITGLVRFMHGFLFVIAIASALFLTMYLFNIQHI